MSMRLYTTSRIGRWLAQTGEHVLTCCLNNNILSYLLTLLHTQSRTNGSKSVRLGDEREREREQEREREREREPNYF